MISFTRQVCTFTPQAFPLEGSLQLIVPYWADVDIRPSDSGNVWYRETSDSELIARARSDIMRDPLLFPQVDLSTFLPTSIFIATWDHVGYYNQRSDKVSIVKILVYNIFCNLLKVSLSPSFFLQKYTYLFMLWLGQTLNDVVPTTACLGIQQDFTAFTDFKQEFQNLRLDFRKF